MAFHCVCDRQQKKPSLLESSVIPRFSKPGQDRRSRSWYEMEVIAEGREDKTLTLIDKDYGYTPGSCLR